MPARRERPAVVLGLDRTGLALVRALGRAGVPVHGISWRRDDVGLKSRYLTAGVAVKGGEANDDEALDALHRIAAGGRAVVFPAEDDWIELILRRWDEVRELADLPLPDDPDVVHALRRKERLPQTGEDGGVPSPRTVAATSEEAIRTAELEPPLLVKPVEGNAFQLHFDRKTFLAHTVDEAVAGWRRAHEQGFETVVQELVPDAHERIYSLFTYVARSGAPLVSVTGRKLRQLPVDFGSSTVFETVWEPRAFELGHKLLSSVDYRGFAHVELAHDRRDDSFKLIEVNTRPPVWVSVATGDSVDIATAAYDDLIGTPPQTERVVADGAAWVDLVRDLLLAIERRELRPRQFAAPYLRRRKARALLAADDPKPVLAWVGKRVQDIGRRLAETRS